MKKFSFVLSMIMLASLILSACATPPTAAPTAAPVVATEAPVVATEPRSHVGSPQRRAGCEFC